MKQTSKYTKPLCTITVKLIDMKRLHFVLYSVLLMMIACQNKQVVDELDAFKAQKELEMKNKDIVKLWLSEVDKQILLTKSVSLMGNGMEQAVGLKMMNLL